MITQPAKTDWSAASQEVVSTTDLTRISGGNSTLYVEDSIYRISAAGSSADYDTAVYLGEFFRALVTVPPGCSIFAKRCRFAAIGDAVVATWLFGFRVCREVLTFDPSDENFISDTYFSATDYGDVGDPIPGKKIAWLNLSSTEPLYSNASLNTELLRVDVYSRKNALEVFDHAPRCDGYLVVEPTPSV